MREKNRSLPRLAHVLAFALAAIGASGCVATVRARPSAGVVVYDAPPPPRVVARPVEPYSGAVWVEGHWQWNGAQWVWQDGYWEQPRAGHVYVQPRWVRRGNGYVYVQGAWQPAGAHVRVHGGGPPPRARGHATVRVQQAPPPPPPRATVRVH